VGDALADRFGDPRWRELEAAHARGEIRLVDLLRFMFESMRAREAELAAHAREVGRLRPGFSEFRQRAQERGIHLVLASGGLDLYIRWVLGGDAQGLTLVANRGWLEGDRVKVEFPYAGRGCLDCGNCKAGVVEDLRARGFQRIVAVGDGTSDRCMAPVADLVVARAELLGFCRAQGIEAVPFEDFFDVARVVLGEG
jgi:2-hydroxy-3-keto-5-methylthiopentenyl-1-phosphate phosphatase